MLEDQSVPMMPSIRPNGHSFISPPVSDGPSTTPCRSEVLEALFTVLPQPLCVFDSQRRLLFANPASADLLGYRVEQLVGHYEWLLLPSDTPRWRRFLRGISGGAASRTTFFRLRHRGGDWLWVHAAASVFTVGGVDLIAVMWNDCGGGLCEDPRTISADT
ncbi:PAS domain S-box protein [Rhodococcus koreensis]|uniref:PAS domain S-box-containing protein n=1 Tax=Rhodococcus koreensis TaxID=99653 RepID=A0A1H4LD08_9NOCA|nr:PAS domain-containing protein [Rhodococcus koreensis]SEB68639.1 PAS domain S-box-containing protein [Rhodococcus koreensis]